MDVGEVKSARLAIPPDAKSLTRVGATACVAVVWAAVNGNCGIQPWTSVWELDTVRRIVWVPWFKRVAQGSTVSQSLPMASMEVSGQFLNLVLRLGSHWQGPEELLAEELGDDEIELYVGLLDPARPCDVRGLGTEEFLARKGWVCGVGAPSLKDAGRRTKPHLSVWRSTTPTLPSHWRGSFTSRGASAGHCGWTARRWHSDGKWVRR